MSEITNDKSTAAHVFDHLVAHLGTPEGSWGVDVNADRASLQVLRFHDKPGPGIDSYVTYGVSRRLLEQRSGTPVRQEYIVCVAKERDPETAVDLLSAVGGSAAARGVALRIGEIIALEVGIGPDRRFHHLVAVAPTWFRDSFFILNTVVPPVAIAWLIPVLPDEVAFADMRGSDAFEDALIQADPDVHDLERQPFVRELQ